MPIIKSAKKRVKIAAKARSRNLRTKRLMRESLKAFSASIESGKSAEIIKAQNTAVSAIDTAAKKAVIHKSKAAKIKSKMAAQAKAAGAKPSKNTAPKTAAKKAASKKATTKKPSAKK